MKISHKREVDLGNKVYANIKGIYGVFNEDEPIQMRTLYYLNKAGYTDNFWFVYHNTDSWIERLLFCAFYALRDDMYKKYNHYLSLWGQEEIENTPYRVDFLVCGEYKDMVNGKVTLVIECDGYDYHSTKEQIKADNKRQREIEEKGYVFLRFSGSEIYNETEKCVEAIFKKVDSLVNMFGVINEG